MSVDLHLVMGLDNWIIKLKDGAIIRAKGFGYSEDDADYVFTGLEKGQPNRLIELVRIPVAIVDAIVSSGTS